MSEASRSIAPRVLAALAKSPAPEAELARFMDAIRNDALEHAAELCDAAEEAGFDQAAAARAIRRLKVSER